MARNNAAERSLFIANLIRKVHELKKIREVPVNDVSVWQDSAAIVFSEYLDAQQDSKDLVKVRADVTVSEHHGVTVTYFIDQCETSVIIDAVNHIIDSTKEG